MRSRTGNWYLVAVIVVMVVAAVALGVSGGDGVKSRFAVLASNAPLVTGGVMKAEHSPALSFPLKAGHLS